MMIAQLIMLANFILIGLGICTSKTALNNNGFRVVIKVGE